MMNLVNETTFSDSLGDSDIPVTAIFGGSGSKFAPNLNASRWSDEAWFNLNYPMTVKGSSVVAVTSAPHWFHGTAQRAEWTQDSVKMFCYDLNADAMEFGFEFQSKPPDLVFDVLHSGLDFFYQPPLTEKEIADGDYQPANVDGSIAVYCKKANNQYKTGKIAHWYRWQVTDQNWKTAWCDLVFDGQLHVLMPDLTGFVYPVIVTGGRSAKGSTFGYTTIGGGVGNLADGSSFATAGAAMSEDGTANDINLYMAVGADGCFMRMGIYDDSTGNANNLLAQCAEFRVSSTSPTWYQQTISLSMSNGSTYHLAFGNDRDGGSCRPYRDAGETTQEDASSFVTTGSLPDPFTVDSTTADRKWSLYINYTAGGANPKGPFGLPFNGPFRRAIS